jgi:hypothetical protein
MCNRGVFASLLGGLAALFSASGLGGRPALAYNGPTHARLFQESVEHLRRLGLTDAHRYYTEDVGLPDPHEGVLWPDLHTTSRPDGNLAEYVLCHTAGCADPGDGDAERKNLDATRWSPFGAGAIRDALLSYGRSLLGESLMGTQKAAAEHQYAPESRADEYAIYLEVDVFRWPFTWRVASDGPMRFRTAYSKVGEYAQRALDGARACDARPGAVWAARSVHFFQDLTCPTRTHVPSPSIKLGVADGSFVIEALKHVGLIDAMACYGRYSDWVEVAGDPFLWEIREHPERFPISVWPGELAAAARETLNTVARIARQYSADTDCLAPSDYGRAAAVLLPAAVRLGAEMLLNHYVRVAANPAGPPRAPSALSCVREGAENVLRWNDPSSNEEGFRIFAAQDEACAARVHLADLPPNATSFRWREPEAPEAADTAPAAPRCYVVEALNRCGASAATLHGGCRPRCGDPGKPCALTDVAGEADADAPAAPPVEEVPPLTLAPPATPGTTPPSPTEVPDAREPVRSGCAAAGAEAAGLAWLLCACIALGLRRWVLRRRGEPGAISSSY